MIPIPKYPEKLNGSFWGLASFYNPCGYRNKISNYRKFRASLKKQGLKLLCVELAFNDAPFALEEDDAEILVQLRGKTVLWHKERLINIGLKHLPPDCDKIAWLDADIIFCNDRWVEQTAKLLEDYVIVQPYSFVVRLPKGIYHITRDKLPFGNMEGQKIHGMGYGIVNFGRGQMSAFLKHGHTGFAWAGRRSVFDKCGFYDKLVLGSGDSFMGHAFYNNTKGSLIHNLSSEKMILDQEKWADRIYKEVQSSVFYTSGLLLHLWHGQHRNKLYFFRFSVLKKYNFDPDIDIKKDENEIWAWASDKPRLHAWAKKYFWLRNEEGSLYYEIILFFYRLTITYLRLKYRLMCSMLSYKRKKLQLLFLYYNKLKKVKPIQTQRALVVKGKSGMGNRILSVLNGIIYSRLTNRSLFVDWRDGVYSEKGINAFFRFFESPNVSASSDISPKSSVFPPVWANNINKSVVDMIKHFGPPKALPQEYKDKYSIDIGRIDYSDDVLVMFSHNIEWEKLKLHAQYFPSEWKGLDRSAIIKKLLQEFLFLKPDIQHRAEKFRAEFFRDRVIGLHIRNADDVSHFTKMAPLERYSYALERLIEKEPNALIFLATDNQGILTSYRAIYKNVIATNKWFPPLAERMYNNMHCLDRTRNGIEALVDMYLLAQCDYLVFSSKSSFGRMARYLSCIDETRIYDVEDNARVKTL